MKDLLTVTDQLGQEVSFSFPPKRIISLVPSQTEFLIDIGAPLVGRTKFCIHPQEKVNEVTIVGGTKNFRFETIKELRPDLIIGNKEENYKEGIEELAKDFPVWMSDIFSLNDSFDMMQALGFMCQLGENADEIIKTCTSALSEVKGKFSGSVVYLMWHNPWMAAGKNTFIDHMLQFLGYENLVHENRYPKLSEAEISALNPDHILLSSEPFPFKDKHVKVAAYNWPNANIQLIDGELFSWYGSRLKQWANSVSVETQK